MLEVDGVHNASGRPTTTQTAGACPILAGAGRTERTRTGSGESRGARCAELRQRLLDRERAAHPQGVAAARITLYVLPAAAVVIACSES